MSRGRIRAASSGSNVCQRHHEVSYVDASGLDILTDDPQGCVNTASMVAGGDNVSFPVNLDLAPNSKVCTRVKNSATNQQWTPYACETIIP